MGDDGERRGDVRIRRGLKSGCSPRTRRTATTTRAQMADRKPALVLSHTREGVHGERRPRPPKDKDMSQKTTLGGQVARWRRGWAGWEWLVADTVAERPSRARGRIKSMLAVADDVGAMRAPCNRKPESEISYVNSSQFPTLLRSITSTDPV